MQVFASEPQLDLAPPVRIVPPGVDPDLFKRETDLGGAQARFLEAVTDMIRRNGAVRTEGVRVWRLGGRLGVS